MVMYAGGEGQGPSKEGYMACLCQGRRADPGGLRQVEHPLSQMVGGPETLGTEEAQLGMASQQGRGARQTLTPLMTRILVVACPELDGPLRASQQPQRGSRAHVVRVKEPAPGSLKGKEPATAARKSKERAQDAARKTKEPAPAAAKKVKEPAPAARKTKEPAQASRKSKEPTPAGRKSKEHGAGTVTKPHHQPWLCSRPRMQGMGRCLPPPAAAPPPPVGNRPRLQVMGRSLPTPAAPPPPMSSRHRRWTVCNPASMGCSAACPLQIQWV
ncbi:hypothetical protein NDU88_004042 [Pleurodeles waltl]|uniref:Uncharacterized protein n=1 Tax=Pleurodeles waltl TaxID=8319 RepID=A0AAV7VIN6_PLEWA|nr:hypothetical protein NDU88_004042 [Pleurodeles waltl]